MEANLLNKIESASLLVAAYENEFQFEADDSKEFFWSQIGGKDLVELCKAYREAQSSADFWAKLYQRKEAELAKTRVPAIRKMEAA